MSGGQLGQLAQMRPPVGVAPGGQPGGPLMATAGQGMPPSTGMPPMGGGPSPGMPQVPWSPPFNVPPPVAGAHPTSTPFYPPLQGGFYNQMTQRLAGPSYAPNANPYNALSGTGLGIGPLGQYMPGGGGGYGSIGGRGGGVQR